ncbi:hypothetical protein [Corynebacterium sp. MSK204]|nr:hypothetical protein [Corynebacterium sp. MSK204]MDK8658823.1 hypothetical protein [Corynebacterium sp. MSK204]
MDNTVPRGQWPGLVQAAAGGLGGLTQLGLVAQTGVELAVLLDEA